MLASQLSTLTTKLGAYIFKQEMAIRGSNIKNSDTNTLTSVFFGPVKATQGVHSIPPTSAFHIVNVWPNKVLQPFQAALNPAENI